MTSNTLKIFVATAVSASIMALCACTTPSYDHSTTPSIRGPSGSASGPREPFSKLQLWDDGLAEMCYYDATDRIYGQDRKYTRVMLLNRQWMDPEIGVKADPVERQSLPVFKLNILEQIPTPNYNYRYQTTVFLERFTLSPFKMALSSQEWCGTSFKHLRWKNDTVTIQSFSYLPHEGEKVFRTSGKGIPYEALSLIARDVVAEGMPRRVKVLTSMRSKGQVDPILLDATLTPRELKNHRSKFGTHGATSVEVIWPGPPTRFVVASNPPHLLLSYETGAARGTLTHVERGTYWDRSWESSFYERNAAP